MIEIIALVFLCSSNSRLARKKGLKGGWWAFFTVVGWLVAELFGLLLGVGLIGMDNLIALMGFGLFCAFGGYLLVRRILEAQPNQDPIEEDIQRIGTDDLRPPKNP